MKQIVVLGGGTGGTLAANRLRRLLAADAVEITVIDPDDRHLYQPGLLFVPFSLARPASLTRPRHRQFRGGVTFRRAAVDRVDLDGSEVLLADGTSVRYDVLIVATGARLVPEETGGLTGPGWMEKVFTFYTLDGAVALRRALADFGGGRLVVAMMDMPVKCPVAPLEFSFLADAYFRRRGIRDRVDLTYVTPLDGAFTRPVCNRELTGLLKDKGISLVTEFNTGEVDGAGGRLVSFDGREVPFDLAVVIPLHAGQDYVLRSPGLGDELGFVLTDQRTLQSRAQPNVFAIGDAADVPASKAGSVAHFEGEVLARNVTRYLAGEPLDAAFDGHTNCFIESGAGRALLIDFNYGTEPLTGHFPGRIGLPLLRESRLNHLGKLAFGWLYWHVLLPGREIPGVRSRMPSAGKRPPHSSPAGPFGSTRLGGMSMSIKTYAGTEVTVNDEGFFTDPAQWRAEMAPQIAVGEGITELTGRHWQVIRFVRHEYEAKGSGPTVRVLGKTSGVTVRELYQLFPKGPAKLAAKIAGIPKPRGCI